MMFDRAFNPFSAWFEWSQSLTEIWFGKPGQPVRRARTSDARAFARIHAASFAHGWDAATFEQMLAERGIHAHVVGRGGVDGFIVVRAVADEAEVLSVAVREGARGAGLGARLLEASLDDLQRERINAVFLEVEAGNNPAIALYRRKGFVEVGKRKGYYRHKDGTRDALTMRLDLGRRVLKPPVPDA